MHKHAGKILEFGFDLDMNWVAKLYGCLGCEYKDSMPPPDEEELAIDHNYCGPDCFGCKARGLQLATGDAAGNIIASGTTQKKWDKELSLYKQARAQGIQPEGTSTKQIQKAIDVSNRTGVAYDASSPLRGIA
jgi:hypothetical protein